MFYDLETTGLLNEPAGCCIVEIYAAAAEASEGAFHALVNPGMSIPDAASQVNHITDEMVKDQKDARAVLIDFFAWIESLQAHRVWLVAHNNWHFDMLVLRKECKRHALSVPAKVWFADTKVAISKLFPDQQSKALGKLVEQYVPKERVSHLVAHRAEADVKMMMMLCECVPDPAALVAFLQTHYRVLK